MSSERALNIHGALGGLAQAHLSVVSNSVRAAMADPYEVHKERALAAINQTRAYLTALEDDLRAGAEQPKTEAAA